MVGSHVIAIVIARLIAPYIAWATAGPEIIARLIVTVIVAGHRRARGVGEHEKKRFSWTSPAADDDAAMSCPVSRCLRDEPSGEGNDEWRGDSRWHGHRP